MITFWAKHNNPKRAVSHHCRKQVQKANRPNGQLSCSSRAHLSASIKASLAHPGVMTRIHAPPCWAVQTSWTFWICGSKEHERATQSHLKTFAACIPPALSQLRRLTWVLWGENTTPQFGGFMTETKTTKV